MYEPSCERLVLDSTRHVEEMAAKRSELPQRAAGVRRTRLRGSLPSPRPSLTPLRADGEAKPVKFISSCRHRASGLGTHRDGTCEDLWRADPEWPCVAAEAGADFVGMMFAESRRKVTPQECYDIVQALKEKRSDGRGLPAEAESTAPRVAMFRPAPGSASGPMPSSNGNALAAAHRGRVRRPKRGRSQRHRRRRRPGPRPAFRRRNAGIHRTHRAAGDPRGPRGKRRHGVRHLRRHLSGLRGRPDARYRFGRSSRRHRRRIRLGGRGRGRGVARRSCSLAAFRRRTSPRQSRRYSRGASMFRAAWKPMARRTSRRCARSSAPPRRWNWALKRRYSPGSASSVDDTFPETLVGAHEELEAAYPGARDDPEFQAELADLNKHYVGRPTPLYFAERLTREVRRRAHLPQARRPRPHRRAQDQQRARPGAAGQAHGQAAHHRRDRRRPARRRHRHRVRAVGPRVRRLHGQRGHRAGRSLNVFRMRLLGAR